MVAAQNRKREDGRGLMLAGEAGVLESEEASGSVMAGGDVTGVLAEVTLVAVALFFEAKVGEGEVDVFGALFAFYFDLWVGLVGGGVAEGDAEDGAVGVAVGVRFT